MRKKLLVCLVLCLVLCMSFAFTAQAETYNISDAAGLLPAQELVTLDENAKAISAEYNCGVYVVIVDDYKSYVNGSIADFSEAVYNSYQLGLGEERNGILLALSMAERDYDLCAYGDWAHYAFTDYGKGELAETFLDDFRENNWAEGMHDYVANCATLMDMARNGNPLDTIIYDEEPEVPGLDAFELMIIVVVSCIVAFAVCGVFKLQMRNTGRQYYAGDYMSFSRSSMRVNSDQFLRRDVVRTRIRRDDDDDGFRPSGGRPGGTSVNAGGFSHKSGKF